MQAITKSVVAWMIAFVAITGLMVVLGSTSTFAAECTPGGGIEGGVECIGDEIDNNTDLTTVITSVVNTLLFVIGIISVIMLIVGGIRYVISGGNQSQVEGARNTILYAIVGLVIAFVAWGVVNFVVSSLTGE